MFLGWSKVDVWRGGGYGYVGVLVDEGAERDGGEREAKEGMEEDGISGGEEGEGRVGVMDDLAGFGFGDGGEGGGEEEKVPTARSLTLPAELPELTLETTFERDNDPRVDFVVCSWYLNAARKVLEEVKGDYMSDKAVIKGWEGMVKGLGRRVQKGLRVKPADGFYDDKGKGGGEVEVEDDVEEKVEKKPKRTFGKTKTLVPVGWTGVTPRNMLPKGEVQRLTHFGTPTGSADTLVIRSQVQR